MIEPEEKKNRIVTIVLLILILLIVGGFYILLNSDKPIKKPKNKIDKGIEKEIEISEIYTFTAETPAELETTSSSDNEPIYFFLFTHTEDPFNHDLSEERYTRLAPLIAALDSEYPEANLTWTIEFQGSDANTVADRNDETGIVDMLQKYNQEGIIDFGYHAHHDPTYLKRPQTEIDENSTWEEKVNGFVEWISCKKDLLHGGCIAETGGGLLAIEEYFGDVEIVTGAMIAQDSEFLEGSGVHAVKKYMEDWILSFGISDHSSLTGDASSAAIVIELMEILTPNVETSGTIFWMDDLIRINDGDRLNDITSIVLKDGPKEAVEKLDSFDRSRSHVYNTHIASKYIYTVKGTSPTIWGYANPESPELPSNMLNSEQDIETAYDNIEKTLEYILGNFLTENSESKFLSSEDVIDLVAAENYWNVSADELNNIANWLIYHWNEVPPNFAYDGKYFYSLRDSLILLSHALAQDYPNSIELKLAYGPFEDINVSASNVDADDIYSIASTIIADIENAENSSWQVVPDNIIDSEYADINTAQVLYAMATIYASNYDGKEMDIITVPATRNMPETLDLLTDLACLNCNSTAWSLKPAVIN